MIAAILLAAAVTKIVNLPQILARDGLLATMPRLTSVIAFEAAMATYLVIGNLVWSWVMTLITFTAFVVSSAYAMASNTSCNCFGDYIDPETMLTFDTVVLLLTGILRPGSWNRSSERLAAQLSSVAVLGGLFAATTVWRDYSYDPNNPLRYLVPNYLIGKRWPINEDLRAEFREFENGKWMILVLSDNCSHCHSFVGRHFSDPETHRPGERTAVFVFTPGANKWACQFDNVSFALKDKTTFSWPDREPFVAFPAVFILESGHVVDGSDGQYAESFIIAALNESEFAVP